MSRWTNWLGPLDCTENLKALRDAYEIALREMPGEVYRETGYQIAAFLEGLIPMLLQVLIAMAASTALGGAIGAVVGAFFGGAGAIPGAAIGAEVGFDLGVAILTWLGLAFLIEAIGHGLIELTSLLTQAVRRAWDAPNSPQPRQEIRLAGMDLARCGSILMRLILQGIVAWLTKKGLDKVPEMMAMLRKSKLTGGFVTWIEQNLDKLLRDPSLRPHRGKASAAKQETEAQSPSQLSKRGAAEEEAAAAPPKAMPEKKVPCFNAANMPAAKVPEFDRQLAGQQKGLNDMTVDEYLKGRDAFSNASRDSLVAKDARTEYQKTLADGIARQLRDGGMSARAADAQAALEATQQMQTLAGLHNPDLVAGGKDMISDFGDKKVNSSIGNQWNNSLGKAHPEWDGNKANSRLKALDDAAKKVPESARATTKMNAKLERCK